MNIIFCLSYLNVPNTIIIAERDPNNFIIFTSNEKIKKLFEEFYGNEKVRFIEIPFLNKKRPLLSFYHIKKAKKKALNTIINYKDCSVFIFFTGFCFFEAWMVKKLSFHNAVFHKQEVALGSQLLTIKGFLKRSIVHFLYGVDTCFHYHYGNFILQVISKSYLSSVKALPIVFNLDIEIAKELINKKYSIDGAGILLLVGSTVAERFVSESEYIKKIDELIKRIKVEGFSICIKIHPRYEDIFSLEKDQIQIPKYLPANLVYDNFSNIVGYTTSTLYEGANDNKNCISLLRFFKPINQIVAEDQMKYLNNNLMVGCKINFPQTVDEIVALLKK